MNNSFYHIPEISNAIFDSNIKLLPSVNELFELELANLEYTVLTKEELAERSAFFQSVNERQTKHFNLYSTQSSALSESRSAQTKNYFENGQFSTGYATHGLFPYRGKFHPQLIKGLLNICICIGISISPPHPSLSPVGRGWAPIAAKHCNGKR